MNLINSIKRGGALALAILLGFFAILIAPFIALGKCFKGLAPKFRIRTAWQLAVAILRGLFMRPAAFAVLICVLVLTSESAHAGAQSQTDTNSLAISSTNTFRLYGDVSGSFTNGQAPGGATFIDCTKADDVYLEVGGFFTNTTAGASNVIFGVAGSVSGTLWTNNIASIIVVVPASSTNWASSELLIQNAFPLYGLRTVANTNGAAVTGTGCYLKAYTKNGI